MYDMVRSSSLCSNYYRMMMNKKEERVLGVFWKCWSFGEERVTTDYIQTSTTEKLNSGFLRRLF